VSRARFDFNQCWHALLIQEEVIKRPASGGAVGIRYRRFALHEQVSGLAAALQRFSHQEPGVIR
jgi:hypothetical protein